MKILVFYRRKVSSLYYLNKKYHLKINNSLGKNSIKKALFQITLSNWLWKSLKEFLNLLSRFKLMRYRLRTRRELEFTLKHLNAKSPFSNVTPTIALSSEMNSIQSRWDLRWCLERATLVTYGSWRIATVRFSTLKINH